MLRRLLAVLVPLLVAMAAAFGVPLAAAVGQGETQTVYLDRLSDASRFAALAENALGLDRTTPLAEELTRYHRLYDIPAVLVDPGGNIILPSDASVDLNTPGVREGLAVAFAGYRPNPPRVVWPWETNPLVVVEPVGRDSQVVAAVVTISPSDGLRAQVLNSWLLLALNGLVPLLALIGAAWPVSRWILRPIRRLDEVTSRVASGRLDARADVHGPPELRTLASSFNTMVDVVGRALRRQRDFVADASHQLRNPLASLRLAVENLAPHLPDEPARQAHQLAVEEAEEMGRVLDALLAATRLDSAAAAEPVELDELVAAHEPAWQANAQRAAIRLRLDIPEGLRVLEPPGGLGSVLDELVGNAIRLSGGTRVRVWARHEEPADSVEDGHVELHVIDDGVGLDEAELSVALHRFWRSPKHQNISGTGLGLAICSELVTSAGGEFRLHQAHPHGLDVAIRLPVAPAEQLFDPTDEADGRPDEERKHLSRPPVADQPGPEDPPPGKTTPGTPPAGV
ncbi:HAMP domain-containing histidine kinase [Crossiella sp. SN42]|uniref:sensor histidine kinase n=1 Tax=Crossiella sp. SN42 TaxID=2944808 RepID=UPI00207CC19F|nr:HAMP domain-containing sensor histidine kinase [Crossiella sp. SN42]MCO1581355.1 HAMP domain-containing histidine kinase [Crossiella sp. SN42]